MVDAGSSGADTFLLEKQEVIDHAAVRVLAFLNIVANGMQGDLEQTVDQMNPKKCAETIKKYPDIIVGVKTAHYGTEDPWDAEHTPWADVDRAEECGRAANVPVMFDFWPRPERSLCRTDPQEDAAGRHSYSRLRPAISHSACGWQDQSDPGPGTRARSDFRRRTRGWKFLVPQCCACGEAGICSRFDVH